VQLVRAESVGIGSSGAERNRDDVRIAERALIEAAQRRDPDAFEQLVRLYDRSVRKEYGVDERGDAYATSPLDARPESSPDRTLRQPEMSKQIYGALDMLSDKERVVFELRHHEGMRLRAIGEALSISEEAAKNCLFRATKKLRGALKDVRS